MSVVIRCMALTGITRKPGRGSPAGMYLKAYDPEAHDGQGLADWTGKLEDALKFETATEAWNLWRTVPKSRPVRPDGKPNRPLTAFTVEIIDA
jgi:hypothetical protein